MKIHSKLLLLIILSCNQFLKSAEPAHDLALPVEPQQSLVSQIDMQQVQSPKTNEEKQDDMQHIQETADQVAQKIAAKIPEEVMHDCVMSIKDLVKEFVASQNEFIESEIEDGDYVDIQVAPQVQELRNKIEQAIAKKLFSLLTPEKIEEISALVSKNLEIQNQLPAWKKVISFISAKAVFKSITYRILGTAVGVLNAYFFLKTSLIAALSLGGIDIGTKIAAYYLHERAWDPKIYKLIKKHCTCCKHK